ncbi:MAG: transposase, partial [Sphaerochaetaceae bacterium]
KRGRPKKGKVLSLIDRLRDLKDDVLRFFTDFRVPFSNNIAERSYRLSKVKIRTAGSFRSADGGANFCTIFSIIDTVRKNGGNAFKALAQLFNNSFSLAFLG